MAGVDDGFTGEARLTPGFTVGYLPQEPVLDPSKDVAGNVTDGVAEIKGLLVRFDEVCAAMGEPDADFDKLLAEQAQLQDRIDAAGAWDLDRKLEIAMDALRLPPADAEVANLSGGERRRVALCRLLLSSPDLLLLDEPTNHLDAESVAWLERTLQDYPGTVVAVTHDRYFLDNVAGWILELDRGFGIPWEGNYSSWLEQKQARLAGEEKADRARQRTLDRELEWVRMSPRARQSKGKARITAYNALVAEAEAAAGERAGGPARDHHPARSPPRRRRGRGQRRVQGFRRPAAGRGLSFLLPPGGIVGVIGPNGAGKTTLFRIIVGHRSARRRRAPDRRHGAAGATSTSPATPSRPTTPCSKRWPAARTASWSAAGSCTAGPMWPASASREATSRSKVGDLSGGERNRVHLAKVLRSGANVLLLDEPTNDLDVDTLRALEDALLAFPGCAVIISHDRWFLDRVATHVLAFEGDSQVRWWEGNFSDYEADRRKRLGIEADQPHRIKYKPLVRS